MGRLFSEHVFSYKIFNSFSPQESRADKTRRMHEWIRTRGKYPTRHELEEAGFKDCLGEVASYNEENSGWSSRSFKNEYAPSWWWQNKIKVREIIGGDDE